MNISIIGAGYVGLVVAACFADVGNDVVCQDRVEEKVALLNDCRIPNHEPDLVGIVERNRLAGRLRFTAGYDMAVEHADVIFIAVGTPAGVEGRADIHQVLDAAQHIGRLMHRPVLIVIKSTVPVGTAEKVGTVVAAQLQKRGLEITFEVVSNPEFLKEGAALADFTKPDRIVIGAESVGAFKLMRQLYAPFSHDREKFVEIDIRSAELTKYAANAMLATRISFMNELAGVAELLGADIEAVRLAMGLDSRIGPQYLHAGVGYGGSCLPKDVQALIQMANHHARSLRILQATAEVNELQKCLLFEKLVKFFNGADELRGKSIALWGLAFKPDTDDMREAPSLALIRSLFAVGAKVRAYDPVASDHARQLLLIEHGASTCAAFLLLASSAREAVEHADALVVMTEWTEFRFPDFRQLAQRLRFRAVFDGRNIYDHREVNLAGLYYEGIGRYTNRNGLGDSVEN
jgi:UDPglucose 6-dehydrogenase